MWHIRILHNCALILFAGVKQLPVFPLFFCRPVQKKIPIPSSQVEDVLRMLRIYAFAKDSLCETVAFQSGFVEKV